MSFRVLVVDDNPAARLSLAALLEGEGIQVVEAGSLDEARRALCGEQLDGAILDCNLGDEWGPDLIPLIREQYPHIRIAILSGESESNADADEVLVKACSPADLLARIRGMFGP